MTDERLPSPLRRLEGNGDASVAAGATTPEPNPEPANDVDPQWLEWARAQQLEPHAAEAAAAATTLLRHGATVPAAIAAGLIAAGRAGPQDLRQLGTEQTWIQSVVDDLKKVGAPADLIGKYEQRLTAVASAISAFDREPVAAATTPATAPVLATTWSARADLAQQLARQQAAESEGAGKAGSPPGPPFSLRDMFAEHSVLILAGLGAFLLVVATVLFELYGSVGLGGGFRLAAVVVLDLVFGVAGYLARRRAGLEAVGQIYIALAAVLLPLVGVASWTFLDLGAHGMTVFQAVAITSTACAVVYGGLASRLDLRAYGEMTGVAILVAIVGVSRWAGGDYWLAAGVALGPLVYTLWQRLLPGRVFDHFQWFGHASAVVALGAAIRFQPNGWIWTVTMAVLAFAYLASQAIAPQVARAWIGEAAAVLAAAAACGPLGVGSGHFVLPMVVGVALIPLHREPEFFGRVGTLYRPHPAHLHLAVILGLALATWAYALGEGRSLAAGLWIAFGLYAADYYLSPTELTGYTLRAALVFALAATGRALELGPWTASLTALALVGYVAAFTHDGLAPLRRFASLYFYGALAVVVAGLFDATIGAGHWEIPAALAIAAVAFGAASELDAVRLSAITARGLFSLGWFAGVDALSAGGWRGPFDALLALFYVAISQVRAAARHAVATASRRWFVHGAAAASLILCFTGTEDQLWWRLAAALAALAVAYWWLALTRDEPELPWLAWTSLAGAAASTAMAIVPEGWQGAAVAGEPLALTAIWFALRKTVDRRGVQVSALVVLGIVAATGATLALRDEPPTWAQSVAALLVAGFLAAWSVVGDESSLPKLRPYERSAASLLAATAVLLACAVLQLTSGATGAVIAAIALLHAEWSVRARNEVERWYALAVLLAAGPFLYIWPYGHHASAAAVSAEFVALAALVAFTAVRARRWYLGYAAALLLAPALYTGFIAAGVTDRLPNEVGFAVLAWLIGFSGLAIRTRFSNLWAWSVEAAAATIAAVTLLVSTHADPAGIALLAYAPLIYTSAMQDRQRWIIPFAPGAAFSGAVVLLTSRNADTILYAAALGVLGLLIWLLGRLVFAQIGRHPVVDMHRYLGLGMLVVSAGSGFFFPTRTGTLSLGAALAAAALLVTGAVLWFDSRSYAFRANRYAAIVAACSAGYFVARFVDLHQWELVSPGIGFVIAGIALRQDPVLSVDPWLRRLCVGLGLGLAMGWAATLTVEGEVWWLVALLVEGALTVSASVILRSRTLLAGGGLAFALASLRAMLLIAQAGYLFAAFAAVALVLLAAATALALGRQRYTTGGGRLREQFSHWD